MGYNPNIPHLKVGYDPLTIHLLTSWDIQVLLKTRQNLGPNRQRLSHTLSESHEKKNTRSIKNGAFRV